DVLRIEPLIARGRRRNPTLLRSRSFLALAFACPRLEDAAPEVVAPLAISHRARSASVLREVGTRFRAGSRFGRCRRWSLARSSRQPKPEDPADHEQEGETEPDDDVSALHERALSQWNRRASMRSAPICRSPRFALHDPTLATKHQFR